MNFKNSLMTLLTTSWLALSSAVSQAQEQIKTQVYQVVWNMIIAVEPDVIKRIKFNDCRIYKWQRFYFSDRKYIIPTDNFFELKTENLEKLKNSPQCEIMWVLKK